MAIKSWSMIDNALSTLAVKELERKALYSILASIYHLGVAGTIKGKQRDGRILVIRHQPINMEMVESFISRQPFSCYI